MNLLRKGPSHQPIHFNGNRSVIIFVTVCTKVRENRLAFPEAHASLIEAWQGADDFMIGQYMIMPDHLHLFCSPSKYPPNQLKNWVEYWKSMTACHWPIKLSGKLWLRYFWDTQLRTSVAYSEKWSYILNNPVRAGLVSRTDDWPFKGILNTLEWHD